MRRRGGVGRCTDLVESQEPPSLTSRSLRVWWKQHGIRFDGFDGIDFVVALFVEACWAELEPQCSRMLKRGGSGL